MEVGRLVRTECSQSCDASNNVKEVRANCVSVIAARKRDGRHPVTYYSGLLASRSSNRSCLEVRR